MSGVRRGLMLLVVVVAAMVVGWASLAGAQMPLTTVQDTVYSANGTPASGTVLVSWGAFTTAGGLTVPAGSTSATIGPGGALSIALAPNAGAMPMGSYYTAILHLSDGTTSRQYWVVPAAVPGGGPTTLAAIKNEVLPLSVAMQTVSKQYVDDAIAAAQTGAPLAASVYVPVAGGSMTGPLLLPADPVSSSQAATKNYVDTNVAATLAGLGQKVSVVPAASQAVAQPSGTNFSISGAYTTTTFSDIGKSTGVTVTPATVAANPGSSEFILSKNQLNCLQQGFDLGNNGTSAQGWSTCILETNVENSSTRGIDQLIGGQFSHNAQGDTAANYVYLSAFGGKVASSDEGVEHTVLQNHQIGFMKGTLSTPTLGSLGQPYANQSSGVVHVFLGYQAVNTFQETGPVVTLSTTFVGTPTAGTADFVVLTPGATAGQFTVTNIVPVTVAATSGTQTWTAGTGFAAFSATQGQMLGFYTASGIGPAGSSIAEDCLAGAPALGAATYTTSGCGDGVLLQATQAAPTTGSNLIVTTGFSCNGYCQATAGQSFADGGILLDTTRGGATAALGSYGRAMNGNYYMLASGSVPVSSAWGNIVPSSCTNNGNGQNQTYTSTTCSVTLGTSPASPGNFVAGQDVFLSGPFEEEAAVTSVGTASGGVQTITFNTRYAWDSRNGNGNAALVMQGGPGGQSFVATSATNSWPVAYAVVGATSPTQVFFSNCVVGSCNGTGGGGNILNARPTTIGAQLTRNSSGTVTATPDTLDATVTSYPVGSSVVVAGASPADLNGTFTVTANTMDNMGNPSFSWSQTGAAESGSSSNVSSAPLSITFYPSAFIIGTNGGAAGAAQLATNTVPFMSGDTAVGAPSSEFSSSSLRIVQGQATPVDGSETSQPISITDDGPSNMSNVIVASNNPANGVGGTVLSASGSYGNDLYFRYRPANNGAVIYMQGGEVYGGAAKPYYIFTDNGSAASNFSFNPNTGTFSLGGNVYVPGTLSSGSAGSFAAGTTIGGVNPCLQNGTNCPGMSGGAGAGTVTSVAVGTWPSWLTPTVSNATSAPVVSATASAIPNAALANSATTVNGQTCALGGTCTVTAVPAAEVKYYAAAVCDSGTAYAAALSRYDNQEPQAGCVLPASSSLGYLSFNAAPVSPQYAETTVATPPYWTGTNLYLKFYSQATTGTVTWYVQTGCTNDGTVVGAPTFSAPIAVSQAVNTTAGGGVTTSVLPGVAAPGTNGCVAGAAAPGSLVTYRVYRSATDNAAGNANLLGVTLVTGRSQ